MAYIQPDFYSSILISLCLCLLGWNWSVGFRLMIWLSHGLLQIHVSTFSIQIHWNWRVKRFSEAQENESVCLCTRLLHLHNSEDNQSHVKCILKFDLHTKSISQTITVFIFISSFGTLKPSDENKAKKNPISLLTIIQLIPKKKKKKSTMTIVNRSTLLKVSSTRKKKEW